MSHLTAATFALAMGLSAKAVKPGEAFMHLEAFVVTHEKHAEAERRPFPNMGTSMLLLLHGNHKQNERGQEQEAHRKESWNIAFVIDL